MSRKIFGTDGVRGRANCYPMTSEIALALGRGIAQLFCKKRSQHSRIVIGKDTRLSGYLFEMAIASGVCSAGADAILLGPLPTPAISFITKAMRADAGIVISASHNPFADNGIKFFDHTGFKLPDELEQKLEESIFEITHSENLPQGNQIGRAYRVEDAPGRYIEFLKSCFPKELSLEGFKIVIDCAHGAAYRVAPTVLEELGAEVIRLGVQPNGLNINEDCGALHPQNLCKKVKEEGAQIGIALDGDADRVILCDEKGDILDGDHILALNAQSMKRAGTLNQNTVVGTSMSNFGLERFLKEQGITLRRVPVGDRYVVEKMRQENYNLGGEPSGHLIFLDHSTTGDGMLAALQVLAECCKQKKPLSEFRTLFCPLPQMIENISVKTRLPLETIPRLQSKIQEIEKQLFGTGRLVIRYSGTEPVIRLMIEGENETVLKTWMGELKEEVLKVF